MPSNNRQLSFLTLIFVLAVGASSIASSQVMPNPYRTVDNWAQMPEGREMGAVGKVSMDPDGEHLWVIVRCDAPAEDFGFECLESDLDPVLKFDLQGNLITSFGGGMFIWPHGIDVDNDGNVWVTDAIAEARTPEGTRGHQVVKFSPEGEVLMVLGTPGVSGNSNYSFNAPSDVEVADNGDIYVADGHFVNGNNRVMKYASDGSFIMSWGHTGYGPGEFQSLHAIALDSRGRVFVADRGNNRIQIFDQEGNPLAIWTQFGKPSGIFFDDKDQIYVADSESDDVQNPGWEMGIRIGDALTGWVNAFVLFPGGDPRSTRGNGAEFVAVDKDGNMYGGEPRPRNLQKYVRVRP